MATTFGPIAQQVFDQMQQDMDALTSSNPSTSAGIYPVQHEISFEYPVQPKLQALIDSRRFYFIDTQEQLDHFEAFQDMFSFKAGYQSEDPRNSFLIAPSAQALSAYENF